MGWYMEGRLLHTEFSEDLQYSQGNTMAPGTYPSTAPPRKWGGGGEKDERPASLTLGMELVTPAWGRTH